MRLSNSRHYRIRKYARTYLSILMIPVILSFPAMLTAQSGLTIMTYNIHHGKDADDHDQLIKIAEVIQQSGADIVGLQEVDSVCLRSGRTDQAKKLAELTGMYYAFVRHIPFEGGAYGIALLSKYSIRGIKNHRLPIASDIPGETRAFLTARIKISKQKKWLIGVAHLDYRDATSRKKQAEQIIDIFKQSSLPGILVGDLNAMPAQGETAGILSFFQDTQPDDSFTYPAIQPSKKIDYILIRQSHPVSVLKQEVIPVSYSDHRPVITAIE